MNSVLALTRAVDFAARKHIDQRRKGARAEPYLNHLTEVARLLAEATGGSDPELVIAGLLHDTLEDTDTSRDEIEAEFGSGVAMLVVEVTDDKSLPSPLRKDLQVRHAPDKSVRARLIKLADKTSNLRGLISSPPAGWSADRRRAYFEWAFAVAAGCRGLNRRLEDWFDDAYRRGFPHGPGGDQPDGVIRPVAAGSPLTAAGAVSGTNNSPSRP